MWQSSDIWTRQLQIKITLSTLLQADNLEECLIPFCYNISLPV
jgi:hypothetical protein